MDADDVRFGGGLTPIVELPSPRTKLVFLYLSVAGEATVEELHEALGIQYLELYSALRVLRERDVVRNDQSIYRCRPRSEFGIETVDGRFRHVQ